MKAEAVGTVEEWSVEKNAEATKTIELAVKAQGKRKDARLTEYYCH